MICVMKPGMISLKVVLETGKALVRGNRIMMKMMTSQFLGFKALMQVLKPAAIIEPKLVSLPT